MCPQSGMDQSLAPFYNTWPVSTKLGLNSTKVGLGLTKGKVWRV